MKWLSVMSKSEGLDGLFLASEVVGVVPHRVYQGEDMPQCEPEDGVTVYLRNGAAVCIAGADYNEIASDLKRAVH